MENLAGYHEDDSGEDEEVDPQSSERLTSSPYAVYVWDNPWSITEKPQLEVGVSEFGVAGLTVQLKRQ